MLERLKAPHILMLIALLVYQGLEQFGYGLDQGMYEQIVDGITYVVFGITIYKSDKNKLV